MHPCPVHPRSNTETKNSFLSVISVLPNSKSRSSSYEQAVQRLLGPNHNETVVSAMEQLICDTLIIMQFCRRLTIEEADVRQAADCLGYQVPESIGDIALTHDTTVFRTFFVECIIERCNTQIPIDHEPLMALQVILESLETGTVTTTPMKHGRAFHLESPTGVTAAVFARDWETFLEEVGSDEEDQTDESRVTDHA